MIGGSISFGSWVAVHLPITDVPTYSERDAKRSILVCKQKQG